MAFGRKKKDGGSEDSSSSVENETTAPAAKRVVKKKRKPDLLLSSVVSESAIGAAIDVLKGNDNFALPNGNSWVGLLLSVDQIGGLNKKQKGDAAKGSIIELIAADKIQVVVTRGMLDEEFLGIVPTAETLERMDEYRLLSEAPYYWVVFRSEGGNELYADAVKDVEATFTQAVAIARGEKSVSEILPHVWAWGGGTSEPELNAEEPSEFDRILHGQPAHATVGASAAPAGTAGTLILDDDIDPLSDAFDLIGDQSVDYASLADETGADLSTGVIDDEPPLDFDEAQFEAQFAGNATDLVHEDEADDVDLSWQEGDAADDEVAPHDTDGEEGNAGYFKYLVENRDRVVDEVEVRDTIARRFLSNDLDLVVDLSEFERVFATDADAISLEIATDASDWLGSQVAQLSRQANTELAQLHRGNTEELRQLYVETMALHIENTMAAVSTDNPETQYSALMDGAKRDFDENRASAGEEIVERRREINEQFSAAAQRRADQAAAHARAVYEDKHRPKLERDLAEVAQDHDRRLEEQYAHDRQTVLELRRKDANVRMDVGTNRIFEHLRTVQAEQREGERALLERWNGQLIQFIDENRKNDIARAMVLADDLARQNQVDVLKKEHAIQLRDARQDAREREEALLAEHARIRQDAIEDLQRRRSEWDASLSVEKERNDTGSAIIGQLREQIETLGAKYENQYLDKIAALKSAKKTAEQNAKEAANAQRQTNRLMIMLVSTLTAAGIAVGVIGGFSWAYTMIG